MNRNFNLKPGVPNVLVDEKGNMYSSARALARKLGIGKTTVTDNLKRKGYFSFDGIKYFPKELNPVNEKVENQVNNNIKIEPEYEDDYKYFKKVKDVESLPFEIYDFSNCNKKIKGSRYAVALFSDAHIDETVTKNSVQGLNEYNTEIAEKRIKYYFTNLVECLNEDKVDELIFASLGDVISGYIHEELSQCNGITPLDAVFKGQNLIYNGIKYICENSNITSFRFIGIAGNHGRTTKKIQHANGYIMNYEWLMYQNIKNQCEINNLPVDFCIPESEIALVNTMDNRKLLFCHGFQIRGSGNGTVCGIYPSLNRLALKWARVYHQDKIYLGHFHQCVSIKEAMVNGSIIGYNSFALSNGMPYEVPAQMYEVYDLSMGRKLLERQIWCS